MHYAMYALCDRIKFWQNPAYGIRALFAQCIFMSKNLSTNLYCHLQLISFHSAGWTGVHEDPGMGTPVSDHDRTGLGIALAIARLSLAKLVIVGSLTLEGSCLKGLGTTDDGAGELGDNLSVEFWKWLYLSLLPPELCAIRVTWWWCAGRQTKVDHRHHLLAQMDQRTQLIILYVHMFNVHWNELDIYLWGPTWIYY